MAAMVSAGRSRQSVLKTVVVMAFSGEVATV
jgi:hypothetical protein